jgi:hypothetical protein
MTSRAQRGQIRGDSDSALKAAYVHSCQLKLLIRRARSEEPGFCRSRCLSRLLQVAQYLEKSLEWLGGGLETEIALAIHFAGGVDGVSAGGVQ